MSKRINTSYVSDPTIQQPFTTKSLDFLQNGILEIANGIIKNLIQRRGFTYSASVPYLVARGTGVYDRYYFFNGELYLAPGVNNLPYAHINTSADAVADPLLFSDNINRDVHNNRYLTFNVLPTGALFALADVIDVITTTNDELTLATQTTTSGTYVDMTGLTFTSPNDGITRKYKFTLKGISSPDVPSNNNGTAIDGGGWFQIWNDTASAELDVAKHYIYFVANTTVGDMGLYDIVNTSSFYCSTIVSLAPNTVIKCRFKKDGGTDVTISECKFFIEEC